jgi:hypothetical protein
MTATICINGDHEIDLSSHELASVAEAMRAHTAAGEARVMREVLWPMDEGGLTLLLADELDGREFAVFAGVVQRSHEQARRGDGATFALWDRLLAAVRADARCLAR